MTILGAAGGRERIHKQRLPATVRGRYNRKSPTLARTKPAGMGHPKLPETGGHSAKLTRCSMYLTAALTRICFLRYAATMRLQLFRIGVVGAALVAPCAGWAAQAQAKTA